MSAETISKSSNIADFAEPKLSGMYDGVLGIIRARHESGLLKDPEFNLKLPVSDQLSAVCHDLGVRQNGKLDHHQTAENFNDPKYNGYRERVAEVAEKLGFVAGLSGEFDGAWDSLPSGEYEVIINSGAGVANRLRAKFVHELIQSGRLTTDHVVVPAGLHIDRTGGGRDTEYDVMKRSLEEVFGLQFRKGKSVNMPYGDDLFADTWAADAYINGRTTEVVLIAAPFDQERTQPDGRPASRLNTLEANRAAKVMCDDSTQKVIASHDTWIPRQHCIAISEFEDRVYAAGPFLKDRYKGSHMVNAHDVVDEIVRTLVVLCEIDNRLNFSSRTV